MSMYQGTNPTALQSQQWLTDSLIALMEEKPFSAITVRDVCQRADLSRQTFYHFFSSKEEILQVYLLRAYKAQFSKYSGNCSLSIGEIVDAFAAVLTGHQRLLALMLQNGLDAMIAAEISQCVALFADRFASQDQSPDLLPYSEALLSGALSQLLVFWFRQEQPISVERITALLEDFFRGSLYALTGSI